jgi:hypothetical protein
MNLLNLLSHFGAACQPGEGGLLLPTWYKYLEGSTDATGACSLLDVNMPDDLGKILLAVVEIMLRLGGIVALFFVIYGGFRYMTSQGESEKTKSARQTIQNAVIGLFISIIATGIVSFVGKEFIQ